MRTLCLCITQHNLFEDQLPLHHQNSTPASAAERGDLNADYSFHLRCADKLPDTGDDADDGVQPFSSEWKAAVQDRVDAFVVSLPLGTTPEDAEIEEKVAVKLYDAEIGTAAVRSLLSEW